MAEVILLYRCGCANIAAARTNLMRAFSRASVPACWSEVDLDDEATPASWKTLGSPTILVGGQEVGGSAARDGASCRLYEESGRLVGAPSVEVIADCLAAVESSPPDPPRVTKSETEPLSPPQDIVSSLASLPGLGLALLPKGLCPACWPAYAAVLSALGLGFLMQDRFLLPLTVGGLIVATLVLALGARRRRGFGPAIVAAFAGLTLLVGKFIFDAPALAYAGITVFTAAAVWNAWPVRRRACSACLPSASVLPPL